MLTTKEFLVNKFPRLGDVPSFNPLLLRKVKGLLALRRLRNLNEQLKDIREQNRDLLERILRRSELKECFDRNDLIEQINERPVLRKLFLKNPEQDIVEFARKWAIIARIRENRRE